VPHAPTDADSEHKKENENENEASIAGTASTSPVTNSRLFDDGLQQVHHDITSQLATVEREGEQVKQVVGYAIIGSRADPVTYQDLQQQLVELLGDLHNSHDGVTLDDIALALWAELTRVSEMALPDDTDDEGKTEGESKDEDDDSDTTPTNASDNTADADTQSDDSTGTEGLGELFGTTDSEDTTEDDAPDRAFQ
jgi:hypothetical protein